MTDEPIVDLISSDDKLWAFLAWILAPVIPVVVLLWEEKKQRPFIRYNTLASTLWWLFYVIVGNILATSGIGFLILAAGFIAAVYWGTQAYHGQTVRLPVITDFIKKQGWA